MRQTIPVDWRALFYGQGRPPGIDGKRWLGVGLSAFSDQYVDAERRAAARGVGVHAHHCRPPWEWRALKRAER
jgi:hypothetical protein